MNAVLQTIGATVAAIGTLMLFVTIHVYTTNVPSHLSLERAGDIRMQFAGATVLLFLLATAMFRASEK
jgi:hypothetical protein